MWGSFVKHRWDSEADTATAMLSRAARAWPERVFIDFHGETRTFREFEAQATQLANGLRSFGIKQGDTVSALLDTSIEGALFWFACNKAGAIYAPMNTALKGDLLAHQLADADSRIIIAHSSYVSRVVEIMGRLRADVRAFTEGDHRRFAGALPVHHLDELLASSGDFSDADIKPSDLSVILYTSGTTGLAKGCMASHEYVCNVAKRTANNIAMTSDDVNWSPLPLFHIFGSCGVVLASLHRGARVALNRRFSVSKFWPEVERSGATILNLVGSMIPLIAGAPENDAEKRCFGRVRAAFGIPFSPDAIAQWRERFGIRWVGGGGYGLTEAAKIAELTVSDDALTSTGKPLSFEVRIFGPDDRECATDEAGEIVVRPLRPGIMFSGYWRRPAETLSVMHDLWFHTGDVGKFDRNGNLIFVDRKKDYMRCGGENVSSYEIETTFHRHPEILDVAAYALPSRLAEDEIKVSIILKPHSNVTEQDLCLWAIDQLPYFCVPHYIEFHQDFPRGPTNKVLKYLLRQAGVTDTTWVRANSGIKLDRR